MKIKDYQLWLPTDDESKEGAFGFKPKHNRRTININSLSAARIISAFSILFMAFNFAEMMEMPTVISTVNTVLIISHVLYF